MGLDAVVVSILAEEIIKPSSPTPSTHSLHKLSLLEQAQTHTYIPYGLFYSKDQLLLPNDVINTLPNLLANSLSKNLAFYYPYAGSLKDNTSTYIECNDVGARFVQAKINIPMSHVAYHPNSDIRDLIFPRGVPWANHGNYLAAVQLSYFGCGGIAISICMSHKIGDAFSAYHFLSDWATLTSNPNKCNINASFDPPVFVQDSLFPAPSINELVIPLVYNSTLEECKQKVFSFSIPKLCALKAYVTENSDVKDPTRTKVASALVFKCAANATKYLSGSADTYSLIHYANLRGLIDPKSKNALARSMVVGNVVSNFKTKIVKEDDMNVPKKASLMRKEKQVLYNSKDPVKENKWAEEILELARNGGDPSYNDTYEYYTCSSLLQFPFHQVDFGWGNPVRVICANGPIPRCFVLCKQPGGEVDAFVTLNEKEMSVFESDADLVELASSIAN